MKIAAAVSADADAVERRDREGYRVGYLAGHADAIASIDHLMRRAIPGSVAVERVKAFSWNVLRHWVERGRAAHEVHDGASLPEFCRHDAHGDHFTNGDDDD